MCCLGIDVVGSFLREIIAAFIIASRIKGYKNNLYKEFDIFLYLNLVEELNGCHDESIDIYIYYGFFSMGYNFGVYWKIGIIKFIFQM